MTIKKIMSILVTTSVATFLVASLMACSFGKAPSNDTSLDSRGYASTSRLVSTKWVNDNLDNKNVKIIDIRKTDIYDAGHLPGALSLSYKGLQVEAEGVKGQIPSGDQIASMLGDLGVESDDTIIIYDHIKNLWSTRLLWTLAVYGHEDSRMMDGSFGLWEKEGKKISTETPKVKATKYSFSGQSRPELVIGIDQVLSSIDDNSSLVLDTRSADEYAGRDDRDNLRHGHIPGSIHVEWKHNVDEDGKFLTADKLRSLYGESAVTKDLDIYTLCQTAVRATHSWFVLEDLLGYDDVGVYDGSWAEWGNLPDTPIDS
jgi:thiosulfate/3-mercaptopyruvate sulfurtransferase